MSKVMILKACTNTQGSESETSLDITPEQWSAMTEAQQNQLVAEYRDDVCQIWVEEGEDDG